MPEPAKTTLYDCRDNPVPAGAEVWTLETRDGITLRGARWPSAVSRHRGTVCLMHGRAEFIEKYYEVIHDLQARGFEVATVDWRGQGGSQRLLSNPRRGHVDDFYDYELDLDAFLAKVEASCRPPYFALGHSTGGAVLLRAARRLGGRIKRMVLTSPLIDFGPLPLPPGLIGPLAGTLAYMGFGTLFVPGGKVTDIYQIPFEHNLLTSDPDRYGRIQAVVAAQPDLALGAPTVGWLYAACRTVSLFKRTDFPPTVNVPTLILTAGGDKVVSVRAQEELALCLRGGGHLFVAGSKHELMMERDVIRNQFWAVFDAFIPGSDADREAKQPKVVAKAASG